MSRASNQMMTAATETGGNRSTSVRSRTVRGGNPFDDSVGIPEWAGMGTNPRSLQSTQEIGINTLIASRAAQALNSDKNEGELDAFLAERRALIEKLNAGIITKPERSRLGYVRWNLDRLHAAKDGHIFEKLEADALKFAKIGDRLADLARQLTHLVDKSYHGRRPR